MYLEGRTKMQEKTGSEKVVSRREFLKLAGVAGATLGVGAGLGGLVAACGGTDETTTTAAPGTTTTVAQATTTTAAAPATTVSTGATAGRVIKIGYVSPRTGALALFGKPDSYCVDRWNEAVADGLVCGDGQNHKIEIIVRDSQSTSDRASQVAAELINNDAIDLMMVASTADTVPPVADQCEASGVPCISTNCPWQSYFFSRGGDAAVGFKWTYHFYWGMEDIIASQFGTWNKYPTNKVFGALWPNDSDGNAYRGAWPAALEKQGYKMVDGGPFQPGTEDFSTIISQFKSAGAEVCGGLMAPPDFGIFWHQALQQGYKPRIVTIGKALLFNQVIDSLGAIAAGLSTPAVWTPAWPFKSSLTGETCQEFCDEYEKRNNIEWSQLLEQYANFEVAVDSLKRTTNIDDKESILAALSSTKLTTVQGEVDFTAPVAANSIRPVKNVYRVACATGQWVKGAKWPFDLKIVGNAGWDKIPVEAELQLLA
jgi:branched-chain amino acid transport system substrate-binding protein